MAPYRNGPLSHGVRRDSSPKVGAKGGFAPLNSHLLKYMEVIHRICAKLIKKLPTPNRCGELFTVI